MMAFGGSEKLGYDLTGSHKLFGTYRFLQARGAPENALGPPERRKEPKWGFFADISDASRREM